MERNIMVVTANIGDIDQKKEIPDQSIPFERRYFTKLDQPDTSADDRTKALWFKTRYFTTQPRGSVTIWLDGKIQPVAYDFLEQIVNALGAREIAVMKHLQRYCIYQEIDHIENCIKAGNEYLISRYATKPIRAQVESYRYNGYPANRGLFDCCIIAFRHTEITDRISRDWWQDISHNRAFDQVALPYHAWRHNVDITPIIFKQGSFVDVPHIK